MVEFFSQEMELSVWRYLSCMAAWLPAMVSLAAFRATLALFSPSAAMTFTAELTTELITESYLGSGFPGGFRLRCHGSLELYWKTNIFAKQSSMLASVKSIILKSHISPLSTFPPHGSVATSSVVSM